MDERVVMPNKRLDPRSMPSYTVTEASHYLNVPNSTVRYWCVGNSSYDGLIKPASLDPVVLLSFFNLVELHVVGIIRKKYELPLTKIRASAEYIEEKIGGDHPLISYQFQTDGIDLFIQHLGELINISRSGQIAIRGVLDAALKRIERDPKGIPIRLFPFTRSGIRDAPTTIVIDPALSGGRPVIVGSGIPTEIVAERYKAGDSISTLAKDYGRTKAEIEEAIRSELQAAA